MRGMKNTKRFMSLILSLALIISSVAIVSVQTAMAADYPLSIMEPPVSQNVLAGTDVTFYVAMLGGVEPYSFQWQTSTGESGPWSNVTSGGTGYTSAILTLNDATTEMSGIYYRCVITDNDVPPTTVESLSARLQVTAGTARTAAPTASYNSGTTTSSNIIGINASIVLATSATVANNPRIFYTTGATADDTPDPTLASKEFDYSESIQAPATPGTFCVKAIATSTNAATSNVATFNYTVTNDRHRLSDIKAEPEFVAWKDGNFLGDMPKVVSDKIDAVIDRMSLTERARFTVGDGSSYGTGRVPGTAGHTPAMIDFGIPQTSFSDGPAGLRITTGNTTSTYLRRPTWWPNGSARSATWNKELIYEMGDAWGAECYYFSSDVQLAPGMNIHRSVLNGRNFEYYSEDPLLSGLTAAMEVSGFQENNPVGMMIKHYAVNNQETNRSNKNTQLGTRALREIYLRNFEYAVVEGNPWAIMNSYNQVNSVSAAQNFGLQTSIARNEWGFRGFFCTDWGNGTGGYGNAGDLYSTYGFSGTGALAANSASRLASGNDTLQFAPLDNAGITNAVANESHPLTQARVDNAVRNLLIMVVKGPAFNNKPLIFGNTDENIMDKNRTLGLEIGEEAVILLKNDSVNGKPALPLDPGASGTVLSLGYSASRLIGGGTGSGAVNMASTDSIVQLHTAIGNIVGSSKFIDSSTCGFTVTNNDYVIPADSPYREQWADANLSAVIYTLGRSSGEGSDIGPNAAPTGTSDTARRGYRLSVQETNLIDYGSALARSKGIPFIVVINHGTWQVFESWIDKADAVVMAWQMGMAGGVPTARVLFGQANPSGKTPTSVPIDVVGNAPNGALYNPSEGQFGGTGAANPVYYNEGIYVGYRYFDTFNVPVSFPFGHGLSYTTFGYSNAALSKTAFDGAADKLTASVTITNTGTVPGKEVVQFYIGAPGIQMPKPVKELKWYEKTKLLQPGESQTITAEFDAMDLASYSDSGATNGQWLVEEGHHVVYFASSAEDIRATRPFAVASGFVARTVNPGASAPNAANQATLDENAMLPTQVVVTFEPTTGASFKKAYTVMGGTYGYLPELPAGYGWHIKETGEQVMKDSLVAATDVTLIVDEIKMKYDVMIEVLEWGSAVTHLIVDAQSVVNASDIALDTFSVTAATRNPANNNVVYNGAREITKAYVSATKEKGKPATSGRYIVLELKYGFNNTNAQINGSAAIIYQSRNYWLNMDYVVELEKLIAGLDLDIEYATTRRLGYDDFKMVSNPAAGFTAQQYRLYTPEEAGKGAALPLILWNHGAGENYGTSGTASNEGAQLFANMGGTGWVENAPEACYVLAPQRSFSSYSRPGVVAFINDLVEKGLVDGDRIYVSGASQGGQETHNYIREYPDLFAGAVPICPLSGSSLTVAQLTPIRHIPIWYVHANDDRSVQPVNSQTPYERLISLNAKDVRRTSFAGVFGTEIPNDDYEGAPWTGTNAKPGPGYYPDGHWSWVMLLNNEFVADGGIPGSTEGTTFMDWLFAQNKWKPEQGVISLTIYRDKISAQVEDFYVNDTDAAVNVKMYVALYGYDERRGTEGSLITVVESAVVNVPPYGGYGKVSIEPFEFGDAYIARAFLWNADNYVPLLESASILPGDIQPLIVPDEPGHHLIPADGPTTIYIDERTGGNGGSFTSSGVVAPDTGHQYLSSFNNNAAFYTAYQLYFEEPGTYSISFRYGNSGAATNQVTLRLDGVQVAGGFNWPASGGWTTWVNSTELGTFTVPERELEGYDFRIVPGSSSINIMNFTVTRVS